MTEIEPSSVKFSQAKICQLPPVERGEAEKDGETDQRASVSPAGLKHASFNTAGSR